MEWDKKEKTGRRNDLASNTVYVVEYGDGFETVARVYAPEALRDRRCAMVGSARSTTGSKVMGVAAVCRTRAP